MSARWTAADQAYLAGHYAADGAEECARHLGRSVSAVRQRASACGLCREWRRWTAADDLRLLRLAAAGVCYPDAARALGRTVESVKYRAHALGARRARGPAGWPRWRDEALLECEASGWTLAEAARELGAPAAEVAERARALGADLPS